MDSGEIWQLIALVILLVLSAFFSSAETALTTVNKFRIKALIDEGNKQAVTVDKVISDSGKMLSAVLIGNNIVNISASSLATLLAQNLFGNYAVSLATGLLTILVLIFGEITPKTVATIHSEKLSLRYAKIIQALMWVLTPVIFLINNLAMFVMKLMGVNPGKQGLSITEGELRTLVDVSREEGVIETEEHVMINNVFDFGDATAKDVMIPRIDVTMADVKTTFPDLLELFRRERFTRIPIYEGSIDNIIGIINMKDLLLYNQNKVFDIRNFLRKAFFTYESKNLSDLMIEMKKTSVNIVIVLDEYGSTAGLITLEDLLEEIVGDIKDEYDSDEENRIVKIHENEYIVEGHISIEDINDRLGTSLNSEDYDSLGGIIIENLDRLPVVGDTVTLPDAKLTVLSLDKKRIAKVRLIKLQEEPAKEAEEPA